MVKKRKIAIAEREKLEKRNLKSSSDLNWWGRLRNVASVDSPTSENIPQLKRDIGILEDFSEHLFLEVVQYCIV